MVGIEYKLPQPQAQVVPFKRLKQFCIASTTRILAAPCVRPQRGAGGALAGDGRHTCPRELWETRGMRSAGNW